MENNGNKTNEVKLNKKPTNKDVAKLAGVSVATVSYVINGRTDMGIPEKTKQKVLHAANFLNYAPNPYAVGLSSNHAHNIVVRSSKKTTFLHNIEIMSFLEAFSLSIQDENFYIAYTPNKTAKKLTAAACICLDMDKDEFYELSNQNFIPFIAVDSIIGDPIFYQVINDYAKIKDYAEQSFSKDYTYVSLLPSNKEIQTIIKDTFQNIIFITGLIDIIHFSSNYKNIVISQHSLFELFNYYSNKSYDVHFYNQNIPEKLNCIYKCVNNAINRVIIEDEKHFISI